MKAPVFKPTAFLLAVILLLVPCLGLGESQTPQQDLASQQQNVQNQINQSQQNQESSPRNKSAGAAQAMAIAGAAMAGVSCMMMMKEAQSMPPGPEKSQMMMMAMQQCQQAAQNAQNAAKNDEAKKAASQNDTPKMAGLNVPQQSPAASPAADSPMSSPQPAKEDSPSAEFPTASPGPAASIAEAKTDEAQGEAYVATGPSISSLKPIEGSRVDVNEANKNDTPSVNVGMGGNGFFGGGRALTADELKKLNGTDTAAANGKAGRTTGGEEPGSVEGSTAGTSKEEGGGGNTAFDQLLGQLMGGAPPPDAFGTLGASNELIALPKEKTNGKVPNIFEYASYRYQVATYDESRISLKRAKQASRQISSETKGKVALKE